MAEQPPVRTGEDQWGLALRGVENLRVVRSEVVLKLRHQAALRACGRDFTYASRSSAWTTGFVPT